MADIKVDNTPDYFLTVAGVRRGFHLAPGEGGILPFAPAFLEEGVPEQDGDSFSYKAVPSSVFQAVEMSDWSLGAGFTDAPPGVVNFKGYSHSQGVDVSYGGRGYASPQRITLDGMTLPVEQFYESPTFGWYARSGQYVYQWTVSAQGWTQVFDSGSAAIPVTDIKEYANSVDTYLFLAFSEAQDIKYSLNGTSWGSSVSGKKAFKFTVRGVTTTEPVLWKIRLNGRASASNLGVSNWSSEDPLIPEGDSVTAFLTAGAHMWVFYTGGYRGFDGITIADMVEVSFLREPDNGKAATIDPNGFVLFNLANRMVALDPYTFTTGTVWEGNHPELNGTIAGIGCSTNEVWFVLNTIGGNVYLMKGPISGPFHTQAYKASDSARALAVAGMSSFDGTNPAVMVGLSAAPVEYIMPRPGRRPEDDLNYRYETGDGLLFGSWMDKGAMTFPGWLNRGRLINENATAARPALLAYGLDGGATYTTLVTAQAPGLVEGVTSSEVVFTRIRHVITLRVFDNEHAPRLIAALFDVTPNPPRYRLWSLPTKISSQTARRAGGEPDTTSFRSAMTFLQSAAGKRVLFEDYFGDTFIVKCLNAAGQGIKRKAAGLDRRNVEGVVVMTLVEIQAIRDDSNVFTWGVSSYGDGSVWGGGS